MLTARTLLLLIPLLCAAAWLRAWTLYQAACASLEPSLESIIPRSLPHADDPRHAGRPQHVSAAEQDPIMLDDRPDNLFFFIQISDIHVSKFHRKGGIAHLRHFLHHTLPFHRPAFVVATGDLTDAKDEWQIAGRQYEEEWLAYNALLTASGVLEPSRGFYWRDLRGNHDCFSVPGWHHRDNFFRSHSASAVSKVPAHDSPEYDRDASWSHVDEFPFGSYAFVAVDGCPDLGTARYLNFFALLSTARLDRLHALLHVHKNIAAANHTFLLTHYPVATIRAGVDSSGQDLSSILRDRVSLLLCGHLHRLALGLGDRLQSYHEDERYLELELPDLKRTAIYRIIAVDGDLISVRDWLIHEHDHALSVDGDFGMPKRDASPNHLVPPVSRMMITNPKDARYGLPGHEPWWRSIRSTHVRLLLWSHAAAHDLILQATVDGISQPWIFSYTGRSGSADGAHLPLWSAPWSPVLWNDGQAHELHVRAFRKPVDGESEPVLITEDVVKFRLDGEREDIEAGLSSLVINADFRDLFMRGFVVLYVTWVLGLLVVPKMYLLWLQHSLGPVEATRRVYRLKTSSAAYSPAACLPATRTTSVSIIQRLWQAIRQLGYKLLLLAGSPVWWCYFLFLLAYVSLPWYRADLFHGRADPEHLDNEVGYVYLVGFWVAEKWQPVLDTWASGFLDLWCWRFPVFLYIANEVTARAALGARARSAVGWVVLAGEVVLWWMQWRIIAHGGMQVVWTGIGGVWWGIVETWWIYWGVDVAKASISTHELKNRGKTRSDEAGNGGVASVQAHAE